MCLQGTLTCMCAHGLIFAHACASLCLLLARRPVSLDPLCQSHTSPITQGPSPALRKPALTRSALTTSSCLSTHTPVFTPASLHLQAHAEGLTFTLPEVSVPAPYELADTNSTVTPFGQGSIALTRSAATVKPPFKICIHTVKPLRRSAATWNPHIKMYTRPAQSDCLTEWASS